MNGSKIRKLRTAAGITLNDLAAQTQTTAGYLSQLERNLVDSSLCTLRKIAQALNTPLFSLIDTQDDVAQIIRKDKREKISFADTNVILEILTPNIDSAQGNVFVMTFSLQPHCWSNSERVSHNVDECFYVQCGDLEVLVDSETYTLSAGDSIYIKANTPHNIYNPSDHASIGISTLSSGAFISVACP